MARLEGEWAAARALYEQALAIYRQAGDQEGVSVALGNLGAVAWEEGDLADGAAPATAKPSRSIRSWGTRTVSQSSLDGLAAVAAKGGAWERAARLAGAAEALRDAIGFELEPADRAFRERYLAEVRERLGEAGLEAALAEGRALTLEQAVRKALEDDEE